MKKQILASYIVFCGNKVMESAVMKRFAAWKIAVIVCLGTGILIWTLLFGSPALAQEAPAVPGFSAQISSLFPERDFLTCLQGHFEVTRETPQYWFVRTNASGQLTVDVSAFAVNTLEESGSITARLYEGDRLKGEVTVLHPSGQDAQNGDENVATIGPVQVAASAVLRLEVTRGAPIATPGEARHYKLTFSDVGDARVGVGVNSPVHKYLEAGPQVFHVNADPGENFRLALTPQDAQATSATVEVREAESGSVLIPRVTVALPHTLAAAGVSAGTLVVDVIGIDHHYQADKQSGSDRGVYFDTCPGQPGGGPVARIPIVDAHSQVDEDLYLTETDDYIAGDGTFIGLDFEIDTVLDRMAANGVTHTILAPRVNDVHPEELLRFSNAYPDKITQAVVTKGACQKSDDNCQNLSTSIYTLPIPDTDGDGSADYGGFLDFQILLEGIDAMGEYLSYHAAKVGVGAGEVKYDLSDTLSQAALSRALANDWPFIIHIEFAALDRDYPEDFDRFLASLKDLLRAYPEHPFPMIHMGQLEYVEVRTLIEDYPNIYFLTSHSNPIDAGGSEPWVNMFKGASLPYFLRLEWKRLIIDHPDRFIFAIDNVFSHHWTASPGGYDEVIEIWRNAFAELPSEVAHAVAHCNAERLWNLPPQGGPKAQLQCIRSEIGRIISSSFEPGAGVGLRHALEASADAASESILRGDFDAAQGQLGAFKKKVAAQAGKKISEDDAARFTEMAQWILDRLEEELPGH